jgi:hypothetical protein
VMDLDRQDRPPHHMAAKLDDGALDLGKLRHAR